MRKTTILALLLAVACGGDEETDAPTDTTTPTGETGTTAPLPDIMGACAGAHTGTFTGDQEGDVTGELAPDGTFTLTFDTSLGPVTSDAQVAEDGTVDAEAEGISVQGTYDLQACTGSGTWDSATFGYAGEWSIAHD